MPNDLWFNLCGAILAAAIILIAQVGRSIPSFQNRIFKRLTFVTLLINLLELMRQGIIFGGMEGNAVMRIVGNALAFTAGILMLTIPALSAFYVCGIFNLQMNKSQRCLIMELPALLEMLVFCIGIFVPYMYEIDGRGIVYHFPLAGIIFLQLAYYASFSVYQVITKGIMLTGEKRASLWGFFFLTMTEIPIRLLSGSSSFYQFELVLCLLFCEFTLQNPSEDLDLDPDSGFWNRNAYRSMLTTEFSKQKPFLLIGILIENLSIIRRTLGIDNTETLISYVGNFTKELTGGTVLFRIDKDSLVIMIPDAKDSQELADRIRKKFTETWSLDDQELVLYAHMCILECPKHAQDVPETLRLISLMTQEAQNQGKDMITMAEMDISSGVRIQEVDRIVKHALENRLLEVYYQPIYTPDRDAYMSAEALLRLHDPQKGFISPEEFIPIAEHNGMIIRIGQFVLNEVCKMLKETETLNYGIDYVEVNLSIVECIQSDLAENVIRTLERHNILPKRVNLEITETAESLSGMIHENIARLSEAGFSFSLDDFGTGYSNLMRTIELPISIIKLDKSLIAPATKSARAYNALGDIVRMNKEMGYESVVEGVETAEESVMVREMGCEHIQGFYYAKPMTKREFLQFLNEKNAAYTDRKGR